MTEPLPEIPGYTLLRPLGEGGMACVYLAVQHSLQRQVALKVMSPVVAQIPEFGQRFQREAHIIARLVHPNIVSVFDVGSAPAGHYVAMEYVEGCDLGHAAEGLGLAAILRLLQEVAAALHCAGRNGIVHRDVKPENILLHAADGRAVLTDFGIAHAADGANGLTSAGVAIGTPHYMSPEQAQGRPVDHRSDLYSLGILLHFLLLGRVPFDADSSVAVGMLHVSAPLPVLPSELAGFQPILDRLLAKEPQQRFADGAQLIGALRHLPRHVLRRGEAFLARRRQRRLQPADDVDLLYPPLYKRPRARLAMAMAMACLAAVVGAGGLLLHSASSGPGPAPAAASVAAMVPATPVAVTPLRGLEARAQVLEAALQAGWQEELEAELAQLYRDWLETEPAAAAPQVALMRLQQQALDRVQRQVDAGDKSRAALQQLAVRYPGLAETEVYRQLERRLTQPAVPSGSPQPASPQGGELLQAKAGASATAGGGSPPVPEVMKLAVSAEPGGDAADREVLTPARTLYVAFEYNHFRSAATVLQAVLFDGARTHQLAAVPVVIDGGAGTQRFRIDRPVDGFGSGGYHLDLFAEGVLLASAEFVVRAIN